MSISPEVRELPKITVNSDTRDVLAAAVRQQPPRDYVIVDVDAHVTEVAFWSEITDLVDNDVLRHLAKSVSEKPGVTGLLNTQPGLVFQDVAGRIPHQHSQREKVPPDNPVDRQTTMVRRAMDAMGVDYSVVFPTPMLTMGMHPLAEAEVQLGDAFNRWLIDRIIPQEPRIKALVYLPFNDPEACIRTVEEFGEREGVIGVTVTSTRFRAVHDNAYMRLYAMLQERGLPLTFHSGYHWGDESMKQCNRFISMHALSFVHYNMLHMTNWVINGLPERFPGLKTVWIESGLAWIPFLMQRLDHEYMMRTSEAPLLKRAPSEYIREMYFSSQPLERSNMKLTQSTFEAINAETQLLFSSDWPHWDFDLPNTITDLPFLSEQAKRNILGLNALRLFNLPVPERRLVKEIQPPQYQPT
jgi:predicted TIM-barrel fold metal-dependent hydrolase